MDDSDQDFAHICSKLLKRVRRKAAGDAAEPAPVRPEDRTVDPGKKRRKEKRVVRDAEPRRAEPSQGRRPDGDGGGGPPVPPGSTTTTTTTTTTTVVSDPGGAGDPVEGSCRAKDAVLLRMQRFKRASPHMLVHGDGGDGVPEQPKVKDPLRPEPGPSDAALALQLQRDLDRQAAEAHDLEARGLFFCQLCHRDLSHMTPEGRAQHLNRCLDETECAPVVPPSSRVADCPICGKRFKSLKSRTAHLKRCSTDMGVAPAVLLQCLQRQAAEVQGDAGSHPRVAARGSKRKEPAEPSLPVMKRPRKKAQPLDEETMVALALSSSLLEREKELAREAAASLAVVAPWPHWRPEAGKGRKKAGKRRKGGPPRPPPLLLVQDPETALTRLQERVAAVLLRPRAPSPPTPTRSPSKLHSDPGAACPLWRRSALEDRDPHSPAQFYTPELRDLLMPREPPEKTMTSISKENLHPSIHSPVKVDTQMTSAGSATLPPAPSPSRSWAGTGRLSVGSQVLRDLMELAEEGRTLSQWLRDDTGSAAVASDLRLSGFVPEKSEENAKLCLSGFLPRDAPATSQPIGDSGRPRGCPESSGCEAVALSRLSSDLSSMVNNPQLSDVQVQVDSGEVYFVHSFMLYARCPLLAQMVHDSGFGVQEQGLPSTQRVLLGESPGEAVLALLQYLYTGLCPAPPASLLPALLELATRFDLEELQHLCQLYRKEADAGPQEDAADTGQPWNNDSNSPGQEPARGDQDFMQLLRSMWNEEEGEEGEEATAGTYEDAVDRREVDGGGGGGQQDHHLLSGDGEMPEEGVNDEEMEEIYEFAATQRKLAEERDSMEQEEDAGSHADDDEEEEEEEVEEEPTSAEDNVFIKAGSPEHEETSVGFKADVPEQSSGSPAPSSLRYSRLFSGSSGVCEEFLASPQPSSPQPSTSWVPEATSTPPHRDSPGRASPRADRRATSSNRTCLQSSPSDNPDLSSGPCFPRTPSLPLPGLSPGRDEGAVVADTSLRDGRPGNPPATDTGMSPKPRPQSQESRVPRRNRQPALPAPPRRYKEPELIVLSDSSEEEMDRDPVPAASPGPSPPPPFPVWSPSHLQYTQIKPPPHPGPTARRTEGGGCDGGQGSACDGLDQSPDLLNPEQMGFSPEVSWLVPATPLQATHSTSSICTQTQSSMCRTRLFPRAGASSSPPRASSSSWSSEGKAQTSGSRSPAGAPLAESSKNGSSVGESKGAESGFDARHTPVTISPPAHSTQPRSPGVTRLLCSSSENSTPSRAFPRPYSSTPLHTDPPKPPVSLEPSLLPGDPEREELWRIHLSQSDPSDSVSPLSLCRDHSGPKGDADDGSAGRRRRTPASDCHHGNTSHSVDLSTVNSEKIQDANESESVAAVAVEGEERGMESEGEHQQVSEPSFCQSFTDEPPMAFNDSWGLDAGGGEGHGGQALCFSLRLEDSGEVGSHQHSPTSSHSLHPPLTPSHYPEGGQNPSASRSPGTLPTNRTLADPDTPPRGPEVNSSLLDPHLWDSWEEEEEEEEQRDEALPLPLSQRVNPAAQFHTPVDSRHRKRTSLVPITPMPSYSDMDTPELKNKLNRFGVRPLPKRQMILKLREIHQYTHQLVHSDQEEDGVAPLGGPGQTKPLPTTSSARPLSCAQTGAHFKRPRVPTGTSPVKLGCEDAEPLSSSQGSSTSSTAASEESAQSNPELLHSSDSESDGEGAVTASQAVSRHQDRVQAVRAFILSNADLYNQVLQYQPLVLSQLQARLKAAGIRLGAAKLLDYLDSQCITVTTAKPGHAAAGRHRRKAKGAAERGARGRKKKMALAAE